MTTLFYHRKAISKTGKPYTSYRVLMGDGDNAKWTDCKFCKNVEKPTVEGLYELTSDDFNVQQSTWGDVIWFHKATLTLKKERSK